MNIYRLTRMVFPALFSIGAVMTLFLLEKNDLHLTNYPAWLGHTCFLIDQIAMWLVAFFIINYGWLPTTVISAALFCKWRWRTISLLCITTWCAVSYVLTCVSHTAMTLTNSVITLIGRTVALLITLLDLMFWAGAIIIIGTSLYLLFQIFFMSKN